MRPCKIDDLAVPSCQIDGHNLRIPIHLSSVNDDHRSQMKRLIEWPRPNSAEFISLFFDGVKYC